jgi:hypothetical protein
VIPSTSFRLKCDHRVGNIVSGQRIVRTIEDTGLLGYIHFTIIPAQVFKVGHHPVIIVTGIQV